MSWKLTYGAGGSSHGIPLAVLVSAANVHDSKTMLATVDAIEPSAPRRAAGSVADRTSSMPIGCALISLRFLG
jgi:hypothetical protein